MRPSATSKAVLGGLVAGLASAYGCSSGGGISLLTGHDSGSPTGTSGTDGGDGLGGGAAGAVGQSGDASGTDGGDDGLAGSTDGGTADTSGAGDGGPGDVITKVVPTVGCGMDPGQAPGMTVAYTIATSGTKAPDCADSVCGSWMYTRQYFITLPIGYDENKAYPLVFQGPGCGGTGRDVQPLDSDGDSTKPNADNTVIRVGLTPPPNAVGIAIRPNQGCFDFADGDNSVDWIFYEDLYDLLAGQLCFDKNRVFVSGSASGGSWFSNELGCKFAGDSARPIRGMLANSGGLPGLLEAPGALTCTTKPMAGMWVEQSMDPEAPFTQTKAAVARAMKVNGCTIGTGYDDATFDNFPIGGIDPDTTCQKINGCPDLFPLVVCLLPGNEHAENTAVANPGFSTFIELFENPPLLTQ